jgi:hypothetical protein
MTTMRRQPPIKQDFTGVSATLTRFRAGLLRAQVERFRETDLPNLYIDEKAGSDTTGTGAELAPFATPLAAYQSLKAPATNDANPFAIANFLVRKADSVERNEWVELGKSAQKKLVKGIDIWRKKDLGRVIDEDNTSSLFSSLGISLLHLLLLLGELLTLLGLLQFLLPPDVNTLDELLLGRFTELDPFVALDLAKEKKEMEERDAKRREEARGVVLIDDPSKEAKKVRGDFGRPPWPVC